MKFSACIYIALCSAFLCCLAQSQDIGLPTAGMRVSSYPTFQGAKSIKSVLSFSFTNGTRFYLWGGNKLHMSKDTPDAVPTDLWTASSSSDFIQSINYDDKRSLVLFCTNERTVWTYSWPNGPATQIPFNPATQTDPLVGCVYDSTRDNLWFVAGGIAVSKSLVSSLKGNTTAFTTSSALTSVSSIVLDSQNGNVLWTFGSSQVQMTPLSNTNLDPSFISSQSLGIGSILTSGYDQVQQAVYLGTDLGIGIEVLTVPSLSFTRYFILPNMQYTSITTDPSHGTSFWTGYQNTTNTQFVVRVNADRFSPFSAVSVTGTDRLGPAAIVNDMNSLWTPFFSTSNAIFAKVQLTDCGLYVCQQCLTNDPQYCGVCSSGQVCTLSSSCSATWQTSGTIDCPVAGAVVPRSGGTEGGDTITITGQFLDNNELLDASQTTCTFGSSDPVKATTVAATFIQCRSPESTVTGKVSLIVRYKGNNWGAALNFTYIKCGDFNGCDICTRNLGCGWCLSSGQCTASAACSSLATWSTVCPAILGIAPAQSSIRGNVAVQLDVIPQLTNEMQYSCDFGFGSGAVVPASFVSSSKLSCTTPTINSATWTAMQGNTSAVTLGAYLTSVSLLQGGKYITSSAPQTFAIYDCPTQSKHCDGCAGVEGFTFSECKFCYDSSVTNCQYSDASCTDSSGTCPNIASLNPPSMLQDDSAVTSVTLTGLFSFTGSTPISNLVCMWDVDSTATSANAQTASGVSATSITCPIPASLPLGTHTVSVWSDDGSGSYSRITSNSDFLVYDCSATGPCSSCVSDLKPKCYWCSASGQLSCKPITESACSANSITNHTLCPALTSVTPDAEEVAGGSDLTLSGSNMKLSTYSGIKCQFISDVDNSVQSVAATVLSDNLLRCEAPTVGAAANYHIDVLVGSVVHTNKIPFIYYQCSAEPSCAECLVARNTRCTWCLGACATQCAVPTPVTCPRINVTDPVESYNKGGQTVRVHGGPFISSTSLTYTCNFGGELGVVTSVSDSYLDCLTPTRGGFASFEGNVDLTILANGAPYTEDPYAFNFFGCPILPSATACGSQCTARAGCGWCVSQSTCTVDFMCNSGQDFFIDKCYNVTVTPNVIRAGSNQTITVQFNQPLPFTFSSDSLFGNNNGKRSILQTASTNPSISCRFGSASVAAVPNSNNNPDSFTCQSPVILQEGNLPFTVLWNGYPLIESVDFQITNCGGYNTDCSQCIQRPNCNWCFESNTCTEADICAADKWGGAQCPSVIETDPQARAGLIAGVVIGGVVIIGGAIFLVLFLRYRKKKQQGLVVDFKEPDYTEVAFKNEVNLQYKITAKDDYEELENILMNRDRTFLKAVAAVTSATEDDAVSRSLTFIAHKRKVASDMIQYFASDEVMKAKSENTIFRQDSLSSKMFKYYSKIVGTRYLFFMLARVINELNELAETAAAAENNQNLHGSSANLLTMSGTTSDPMSQGTNDLTASEGGSKRKSTKKKSVIVYEGTEINRASASLLNFDMELDPVLLENKEVDTEANVYQLELACQKILTVIINNENKVPREFREIFVRIENAIKLKFGNETAAYKAVGGFLFLRFICPAITVPQYYGLISEIPNKKCQRQLILIAKVLQNMANLATMSHKETFMKDLESFMTKNQPKFVDLYQNLLNPEKLPDARARLSIEVPENARLNSLAFLHQHIHRSEKKLRTYFEHLAEEDADKAREMNKLLDEIIQNYGEPPKKKEDK